MDIKDILAISGQPGLYRMVTQGKNSLIVENLETGKRIPAHARHKISGLADIALFTESADKPLKDFFRALFEMQEGKAVDQPKKMSNDDLKSLFAKVLPDYDRDRVYVSDMKKAIEWYNILVGKGMIDLEPDEDEAAGEQETAQETEQEKAD